MDPQALNNLDPKLRETYERVMGTSSPATPTTAPLEDATKPTDQATQFSSTPLPIAADAPIKEAEQPTPTPQTSPSAEPEPTTVNITQAETKENHDIIHIDDSKGHQGLLKVLYVLGGSVFFLVYAFFWANIFNFPLPF